VPKQTARPNDVVLYMSLRNHFRYWCYYTASNLIKMTHLVNILSIYPLREGY